MNQNNEFHIGYLPKSPPSYAKNTRLVALLLALILPALIALIAAAQQPVDEGTFEFGVYKNFTGVLVEEPLPYLILTNSETGKTEHALLSSFGKFGLPAFAKGNNGKQVSFKGSLITRKGMTMIEMNDAQSFQVLAEAKDSILPFISLGTVTLAGEIVDSKCFLGVMRPATGKVHRACAIRCLEGGIPPAFRVIDSDGAERLLVLAPKAGKLLDIDLQLAGIPVELTGELERNGEMLVLRVDRVRRL